MSEFAIPHHAQFDAPDLAPVIACEHTNIGWRGLTEDGEILNVRTHVNGTPTVLPESISVVQNDKIIGYRALPKQASDGTIAAYVQHLDASTALVRVNEPTRALAEIDVALAHARTMLGRYNRAMILLSLGQWQEGFDEFAYCEQNSPLFMRPKWRAAIERGLTPWRGEDIAGKRLLLIHDHGLGDSIMMLRYVAHLRALGADVILQVPRELQALADQVALVSPEFVDCDYFCGLISLLGALRLMPDQVPLAPYLKIDPNLVAKWRDRLNSERRPQIGVAWSVGKSQDGDYPRALPLATMYRHLGAHGDLVSVQRQGEAECDLYGVQHFRFDDFADCAALMSILDEIVTVDTAAVHLAGAIGHPRLSLLLSHWSSWRWLSPLYQNVKICRQDAPGDWDSAFAKRLRN